MNVFRRNKSGTSSMRMSRKTNNQNGTIIRGGNESKDSTRVDDGKVRYSEEETNSAQVVKGRRPRRHTTGGSQHKEAIQKAKDMVANDPDIDTAAQDANYGTLNRKELISMLKDRYGNDMEKYRSLRKNEKIDVEHRTVESNAKQRPKTSGRILTYKTSSELNGHVRRGSTSSQEGSQTSQESIPYSATPPSYDSHSSKAMQTAALRQYAQRNRKISNGSSVLSGYSSSSEMHHMAPQVVEKTHQTVTTQRRVVTQEPNGLQKRQQSFDEQQQQHLRDLAQLDREQQVLMTERQNTAHYQQQQQQQQPASQGDRDRVIYLQFKDEIKRVNMPAAISSLDTLKALFVTSFPGKLSMVRLDERGLIYIKDKEADLFYELEDIRDVQPRSHIQLRERSTSFESLSSSHTDMSAYDRKYTNNLAYNAATLPSHGRMHRNEHYAESLQDFEVRPRSGSGSSLRSDSVLTKPTWHDNYQQSRPQQSSHANNGLLSPRLQKRQIQTVKTETTRYDTTRTGRPQQVASHEVGKPFAPLTEPPRLKSKKPSEKEKKGPTVEEQLVDLTKLLHTALNSDEEDGTHPEQPTPGKLDQNLMDNLEALSEDNYSKSPTKGRFYTPTALLAAKKRQMEGSPEDGDYFNFNTGTYTKTVTSNQMPASQPSEDDPDKGYMHDGPEVYMRSGNSKLSYESGVADSLLQSLRAGDEKATTGQQTKTKSRAATTIRITASSEDKSQSMNQDSERTSPPPTPTRSKSSQIAAQAIKATMSPPQEQKQWTATAKVVYQPSHGQTYKMDRQISIASSAAALRSSVLTLRSQIDELKLLQTNQTRNFKSFLSQSLQDFNALASSVSQNLRNSKDSGNSIRDRRFRVQEDYDAYLKRMQNVSGQLSRLEEDTERMRRGIVQRKQGLDVAQLNKLNRDLESLGKFLAELKSRFSGLHDMLKIVMAGELEIIVSEERFLKDEPGNLDNLFARCKHLSGTIFALQRLASAQQLANSESEHQDINQNRVHINANSSENGSAEDVRHRVTRTVRFTSKEHSGFL